MLIFLGGCNGYSYTMNYATQDDVDSKKYEMVDAHNVLVLVDPKAIFYVVGTEMDYEVSLNKAIWNKLSFLYFYLY